jgi:uncharacterized repeat protein (TIGR04076 family)
MALDSQNKISLDVDFHSPMPREDYLKYWDRLSRIEIRLVEKTGACQHNLGDVYYYDNPYKRPEGVCFALLHVLQLYTWRVTLGFPSWNDKDPKIYRIHCPDHTGTIWEMRRLDS